MYLLFFLIIPIIFAFFACKSNKFIFKALETSACLVVVTAAGLYCGIPNFWYLPAAFLASIAGDYFLSFKEGRESYFVLGIALYFLAHVGYLLYIVMSFDINLTVFAVVFAALAVGYLIYFFVSIKKNVSGVMMAAVLMYLVISCVVLAFAVSAAVAPLVKVLMTAAIALIVLSDTIIAESEFMDRKRFSFLILPTYYAAQILLSASFVIAVFA